MECTHLSHGRPCLSPAIRSTSFCSCHTRERVELPAPDLAESPAYQAVTAEVTPVPEPGEVTSGYSVNSKHCSANNHSGEPCGAFATTGSDLCFFHDPAAKDALREAQSSGGSTPRRNLMDDIYAVPVCLYNPAAIQAAIEHVFRMQIVGAISDRQVDKLVKVLRLATANARNVADFGDRSTYINGFDTYIDATELIVDRLEARDRQERPNSAGS